MSGYPDDYRSSHDPYQRPTLEEACPFEVDALVRMVAVRKATVAAFAAAMKANGFVVSAKDLDCLVEAINEVPSVNQVKEDYEEKIEEAGYTWCKYNDEEDVVQEACKEVLGLITPDRRTRDDEFWKKWRRSITNPATPGSLTQQAGGGND